MTPEEQEQEIEKALSELPAPEYAALFPIIRQIVTANLRDGRAQRMLAADHDRSLADYVHQVAQVIRDESERLERLSSHDDAAWEGLSDMLRGPAYRQLMRLGVKHAEAFERAADFVQDMCVALLQIDYPGDVPYTAWAKRVLRHRILHDLLRQPDLLDRKALFVSPPAEAEEEFESNSPSVEDFTLALEDRQAFDWALEQLPSDAQREVLRWTMDGWSDEEIAARTGRSVQAVYNLRHRARQELKRLLGSEYHGGHEAPPR